MYIYVYLYICIYTIYTYIYISKILKPARLDLDHNAPTASKE